MVDPMRRKQFATGLEQLAQEGTVQLYRPPAGRAGDLVLGALGQLQFEVVKYRLEAEYGVKVRLEAVPYQLARWVSRADGAPLDLDDLHSAIEGLVVLDVRDRVVALFDREWALRTAERLHPELRVRRGRERSRGPRRLSRSRSAAARRLRGDLHLLEPGLAVAGARDLGDALAAADARAEVDVAADPRPRLAHSARVQVRRRDLGDEELRAVRVRAHVRHRELARRRERRRPGLQLVVEAEPRPARCRSRRSSGRPARRG